MGYKKGVGYERELVNLFWKNGWAAIRVPGSGGISAPVPDIVAGKGNLKIAVQCKAIDARSYYIKKSDINSLVTFCSIFGALPYIGFRLPNRRWIFVKPEDFEETDKSFKITKEKMLVRGIEFKELIGEERQERL